jgi:hypothetical protein
VFVIWPITFKGPVNLCDGDAECFCRVSSECLNIMYVNLVHYRVKFLVGSCKGNGIEPRHECVFVSTGVR